MDAPQRNPSEFRRWRQQSDNPATTFHGQQDDQEQAIRHAVVNLSLTPSIAAYHAGRPDSSAQGALRSLYELQRMACMITGLSQASLAVSNRGQAMFCVLAMVLKSRNRDSLHKNRLLDCTRSPSLSVLAKRMGFIIDPIDIRHLNECELDDVAALILPAPSPGEATDASCLARARQQDIPIVVDASRRYYLRQQGDEIYHFADLVCLDLGYLCDGNVELMALTATPGLAAMLPLPYVEKDASLYRLQHTRSQPRSVGLATADSPDMGNVMRIYLELRLRGLEAVQRGAQLDHVSAIRLARQLNDADDLNIIARADAGCCSISSGSAGMQRLLNADIKPELDACGVVMLNSDGDNGGIELHRLHRLNHTRLDRLAEKMKSILRTGTTD